MHKPGAQIFDYALDVLNVAPEMSLFVGDDLTVDAIGAVKAGGFGMGLWLDRRNIGIDRGLPPRVARITSLKEVLTYV